MNSKSFFLNDFEMKYSRKTQVDKKYTKETKVKMKREREKYSSKVNFPTNLAPLSSEDHCSLTGSSVADDSHTALDLQRMVNVAQESHDRVDHTLKSVESSRYRTNSIGSKGGHIARKWGAPGPLNGHRVIKPEDRLLYGESCVRHAFRTPQPFKPIVQPNWDALFVHREMLKEDVFNEPEPKKVHHNKEFRSTLEKGITREARNPKSAAISRGASPTANIFYESCVVQPASSFPTRDETPAVNDEDFELPEKKLVVEYPASYIRLLNAEYMWLSLLDELKAAAANIKHHDLAEIAGLHHPSDTVVRIMSYFNILLGITPTWDAARKYIFKELSSLLKFLAGVEPLVVPERRLKKAIELRYDHLSDVTPTTVTTHCRPLAKIFKWVLVFNKMASLILSINRRKEGGLTIEETEQQIAILQLDNLDEQLDQQLAAEAVDGFPVPRDDATVMSHITLPSALLQTARKEESIDASDAEETEEHYDSAMLPALRVQFFTKMSEDSSLFETLSEYLSPYAPIPDPIEVPKRKLRVNADGHSHHRPIIDSSVDATPGWDQRIHGEQQQQVSPDNHKNHKPNNPRRLSKHIGARHTNIAKVKIIRSTMINPYVKPSLTDDSHVDETEAEAAERILKENRKSMVDMFRSRPVNAARAAEYKKEAAENEEKEKLEQAAELAAARERRAQQELETEKQIELQKEQRLTKVKLEEEKLMAAPAMNQPAKLNEAKDVLHDVIQAYDENMSLYEAKTLEIAAAEEVFKTATGHLFSSSYALSDNESKSDSDEPILENGVSNDENNDMEEDN